MTMKEPSHILATRCQHCKHPFIIGEPAVLCSWGRVSERIGDRVTFMWCGTFWRLEYEVPFCSEQCVGACLVQRATAEERNQQ